MVIGAFQKFSMIDYPGKTCAIIFTTGCNFRCPFCHNKELVLPEEFPEPVDFEEVKNFLKSRVGLLDAVEFTGGEPLINRDILTYVKEIKDMGFLVKIDTNGSVPSVLKEVIPYADYVAMDIKAPLEKYHLASGVAFDVRSIKESVDIIIKEAKDYEFRTTIFKNFIEGKEDMIAIGKLIEGAKIYYIQRPHFDKVLDPNYQFKLHSAKELEELKEAVKPYVKEVIIR